MSNGKQAKVQKDARDYRRFIEESFPVKEVGAASSKEKSIRHGHISTLHIWWARRPLAASRATAYAALTPAPKDAEEWQKKRDFIIQLCQWENSNNQSLLERARSEILEANGGVPPKVLDPFSGGGSYPLEAMRLGCESYANDYNPVAVLIEKATLEFPQKFGRPFEGMPEWAKSKRADEKKVGKSQNGKKQDKEKQLNLLDADSIENPKSEIVNPLLNAVSYWGDWVLDEARKELNEFYPPEPGGSIPVGFIWARTIPCQNPSCGQNIPLMRGFWLSKKDKKKVALYPKISKGKLEFKIVGDGYQKWPEGFDPDNGTISRAVATCFVCGNVVDDNTTRRLFQNGNSSEQMVAIVSSTKRGDGKTYRIPNEDDLHVYERVQKNLISKRDNLKHEWGVDPVPDEEIPLMSGVFNVPIYGMKTWGDLFNSRQKYTLITFASLVRKANDLIQEEYGDANFAKAVTTYLSIVFNRLTDKCANLVVYNNVAEKIEHVFGRQALPMVWDYVELNPFTDVGWPNMQEWVCLALEHLSQIPLGKFADGNLVQVTNSTATKLPYSDNFFDCILTDPPYYNSVPYADLSDYFYVWFKRTLGHIFPELFSTPMAPKEKEITEMAGWDPIRYPNKDKKFFEDGLKDAFLEIHRVLKPKGIATIVYAHKSTEGWETVINALLDSGLIVSGAWPINTERQGRLRANDSAALGSSIYIVVRKLPRQSTGFYNDVRNELRQHLDSKLHRLWEEGIGGADFFIAAIGSAIEVFGKYEQVMDFEGNIVRANRLLEEVRVIATNYAVKQILHDDFATEVSPIARFYVLWRWNYGEALVPFDEANKLAHSCGLDLSLQFGKNGFIKKEKEFARLLGPQGRKLDDLDDPRDMIDVLHKSLLLWEKGQRAEMVKALADRGFGKSEAFYRVAQAISETLPLESKEKKLLDGFLAGRDRVQQEVEKSTEQGKLL